MADNDDKGALPDGWKYVTEETEHPYYWHIEKGDVQWDRPSAEPTTSTDQVKNNDDAEKVVVSQTENSDEPQEDTKRDEEDEDQDIDIDDEDDVNDDEEEQESENENENEAAEEVEEGGAEASEPYDTSMPLPGNATIS